MTDGPHKSLKMNPACRRLAERAWNSSYSDAEVAACIPGALLKASDSEAIMRIGEILNPNGQPRLFPLTPAETGLQIDQVRRQFPGSSFVDQLANEAIYQVHHQPHGPPTIETCLKPAIEASYRSISGGIEEHGLQQRGAEVAQFYQNRLAEAWKSLDLPEFLQALLHQETSRPTRPKSRTDLDDGVPL